MIRRMIGLAILALAGVAPALAAQTAPTVVYLVRHAETAPDGTRDPALSEAGRERAVQLAHVLSDAGIGRIHSTDLRRTRKTGGPVLELKGLELELYDPFDLTSFAARLRAAGGRHLVLGHSNTTPALVEALGGEAGPAIAESEYDRLYILTLLPDGAASTTLLRYGADSGH